MFVRFATAAAALALMTGVAAAQSTSSDPSTTQAPAMQAPVNPDPTAAAPADQTAPADPTAATTMAAPTGTATDTAGRVMTSSASPEEQATLKAGDPNVTSNAPVADTPANRKLYGRPLSNAGKHTAAKGN